MAEPTRVPLVSSVLLWSVSFLAIPIAGYLGTLVVGRVDDIGSALVGGAIVGLVVGIAQSVASRGRLPVLRWTAASSIGLGAGVAAGTAAIGFHTTLPELASGGAITGVIVGAAQAFALPSAARPRWVWIPITAGLWPVAWTVTTLVGIQVDLQFIVFGASGAIVYTVLAGAALSALTRPGTTGVPLAVSAVAVDR